VSVYLRKTKAAECVRESSTGADAEKIREDLCIRLDEVIGGSPIPLLPKLLIDGLLSLEYWLLKNPKQVFQGARAHFPIRHTAEYFGRMTLSFQIPGSVSLEATRTSPFLE